MDTTTKGTEESGAPSPGNVPTAFRKVLVVDDDPAMRRILTKVLEAAGYEVICAGDGSEAIKMLQQAPPSFVITDWDMPVLNGAEFCRMVRLEDLPHYVYIVMLTGSYTNQLVEGLSSGADDFVTKPVKSQELLARMQAGTRVLEVEEKLSLLASHDPLTELVNRRTFFTTLDMECRRSQRTAYPLSCVMIDVDLFKKVNDTHGHMVGDAVLKSISSVLTKCCRDTDCVGRYGGEEFAVMLPDTDEHGAMLWAERCRLAVAEALVLVDQTSVHVTASMGVAQRNDDCAEPKKLLDVADQALLEAKSLGRNRVVAFSSMMKG